MNSDTIRTIEAVKKNGYWRQGISMGEGGWEALHAFASQWNQYALYNMDSYDGIPTETIHAKDDETAIKAFQSLYRLGEFAHKIYKVETKYTLIQDHP